MVSVCLCACVCLSSLCAHQSSLLLFIESREPSFYLFIFCKMRTHTDTTGGGCSKLRSSHAGLSLHEETLAGSAVPHQ